MVSFPKFTRRAAEYIARSEEEVRRHDPSGSYLSFIGWGNDVEPDPPPGPAYAIHYVSDASGVPDGYIVECHGVRLAYNIHERLLARLRSPVLDFDGERLVFVEDGKIDPEPPVKGVDFRM
ncbi:MAG: hypothetical protein ACOY4R_06480 [Pseudomonadota bacterium]